MNPELRNLVLRVIQMDISVLEMPIYREIHCEQQKNIAFFLRYSYMFELT